MYRTPFIPPVMDHDMGLGEIKEEHIEMLGEKLENLRVQWKPAKLILLPMEERNGDASYTNAESG